MSTFDNISNDVLQESMMYLPFEDIINSGMTNNRKNCRLCKDDAFWKNYFDMNPEQIPRVFMKALKEDDKLYIHRASSHPKFLSQVPVMMEDIAEGPYNGKDHLISDAEKRVIELVMQHYEHLTYDAENLYIDNIILMLMTNGHIDALNYLIEMYTKYFRYYPWSTIREVYSEVYEYFNAPHYNEYDFVEYLRMHWMLGQVRGQALMWEYLNRTFYDIPDFEVSTMITKVATSIQRVCQSDMDPEFYIPITERIIELAVSQEEIDFDIDTVVHAFEASDFGSSYLIRMFRQYQTPGTERFRE